MGVTSRPLESEEDFEARRRFLVAIRPRVGTRVYATVGELDWWRRTDEDPQAIRRARVWVDDQGEPVGFAWPGDDQVDLVVHADHRQLDDEMLSWAEEKRRRQAGAGSTLRAGLRERSVAAGNATDARLRADASPRHPWTHVCT